MNDVITEIEMYLDMDYQTEIVKRDPTYHEPDTGLVSLIARGRYTGDAIRYTRPMFEVIPTTRQTPRVFQVPCSGCGDFSRSWSCPAHTLDDAGEAGFDETD